MVRVGDIVTIDVNKYLNPGSEKTAPKRVRGKVIAFNPITGGHRELSAG